MKGRKGRGRHIANENVDSNTESETELQCFKKPSLGKRKPWNLEQLSISFKPQRMVGREEEQQAISKFVKKAIMGQINSKVLCVPGIGKTAAVTDILRLLKDQLQDKITVNHINCLALKKPADVWNVLVTQMQKKYQKPEFPKKLGFHSRYEKMQTYLQISECHHIYVVDEVDFLVTKDQEVLYNLFNLAYEETTKLVLIMIANTMDFPKQLTPKVQSRMGDHHLVFKQYTKKDIKAIIEDRLKGCPYFDGKSIDFASSKLAFHSSDIRLILEVLYKASQLCMQQGGKKKVTIQQLAELYEDKAGKKIELAEQIPLYQRIMDFMRARDSECYSIEIYEAFRLSQQNMMIILKEMQEMKLISMKLTQRDHCKCHLVSILESL